MKKTSKVRRFLAVMLTLCMVSISITPAFAANYSDTAGHWAEQIIDKWSERGVLLGYEDNSFKPNAIVTRGEAAKVLSDMLDLQDEADNTFGDLDSSAWYADYLLKAVEAGIFKGSDGNINPTGGTTRQEGAAIFSRTFNVPENTSGINVYGDATDISGWAAGNVGGMTMAGYMLGDNNGNFRPLDAITRAEFVAMIDKAVKGYITEPGEYTKNDFSGNGVIIVKASDVVLDGIAADYVVVTPQSEGGVEIKNAVVLNGVVNKSNAKVATDGSVAMSGLSGEIGATANPSASKSPSASSNPTTTSKPSSGVSGGSSSGGRNPRPTSKPSESPSTAPSESPSETPSSTPSETPSSAPSETPSATPSATPSSTPSATPSSTPSATPSSTPSETPSATPLDESIAANVPSLNEAMTAYATADWNAEAHTLTVDISDGETQVGTVKTDIESLLLEAFNASVSTLTSVVDSLNSETTLDISSGSIDSAALDKFITALKMTDGKEQTALKDILGEGMTIDKLIGKQFEIKVTPKDGAEVIYIIKFVTSNLDKNIESNLPSLNEAMTAYAKADWKAADHTLTVDISNGKTQVGTVKTDIENLLLEAFNASVSSLTSVADNLNDGTTLDITSGSIDSAALDKFIKALKMTDGKEQTTLTDILGSGMTIEKLVGKQFEIKVTPKDGAETIYIIKFVASDLDTNIAANVEALNGKMAKYATADWNAEAHTLTVDISDGKTLVGTVKTDIEQLLIDSFNKSAGTLSEVKDALNETGGATLDFTNGIDSIKLVAFIKGLYIKDTGSDAAAEALTKVLASAGTSNISALIGKEFNINVTAKGDGAPSVAYVIKFVSGNALDTAIVTEIDELNTKMTDYAALDYNGETHTLDVTVKDDTKEITAVKVDIEDMLVAAFNKSREQITSVQDGINKTSPATLAVDTAVTGHLIDKFILGLYLSDTDEAFSSYYQEEGHQTIGSLKNHHFVIDVTFKGDQTATFYTINFAGEVTP